MKLGYVLVYVPDVEEAVRFYEKAFGLTRRFVHESGYGELDTGGTALGFVSEALAASNGTSFRKNRAKDAKAAGVEIAFVTDDPKAAYARAVKAGAARVSAPKKKPWGQVVAYVRDLNGVLVEICSPMGG